MSKPDTWMPLVIGDYLKDTSRLTTEQHGAYLLLIMDYWVNGPPTDDDDELSAITKLEAKAWRRQRPKIERFFRIEGGVWRHKRIDEELEGAQAKSGKAAEKARAAAQARWERARSAVADTGAGGNASGTAHDDAQAHACSMLEDCPSPSPTPNGGKDADASSVGSAEPMPTEEPKPKPWERDDAFAKLWDMATEQGRKRAKRKEDVWPLWRAALKRWRAEQIYSAKAAYLVGDPDVQRTGGPGLHIWLRDKCEHWIDAAEGSQRSSAWTGPPEIAAIMKREFGPEKGPGYLASYCTWQDVPNRALICSNGLICDMIRREAGAALEAIDVRVLVSGRAA